MSSVTNVILKTSLDEEEGILALNATFVHGRPFISCDSVEPMGDGGRLGYGGNKQLECDIYLGAFNGVYVDEIRGAVAEIKWDRPECVQLFLQGEHDDKFREVDLGLKEKDD
jgi:hypothetical protein